MKQIGIIGLGGISQKAYLPYMRQLSGIHWHLSTRNKTVLSEVADLFGNCTVYDTVEELSKVDLDGVFIHAATVAHVNLASLFLKKGIPVYMDKPLTEDYDTTRALYQLAQENNTFLMAGFNRRFAPKVIDMVKLEQKKHIYVTKNDVDRPGDFQFKLFDFFIHPLDTALYLASEKPIQAHFQYHKENNQLYQITITLQTAMETIIASMNLQSGSRREVIEVQTPKSTYHLENLDELTIFSNNQQTRENFGSWDTTLYKRGFETIIHAFLEAIETGINPVSPESSLLSHWICDQVNKSTESSGQLDLEAFYGTTTTSFN